MSNEYDLKTYKYGPASGGQPKELVILLHGLGSNGQDLISLAPFLAEALPDAMFVSPDAPYPCDMAPVGYQWFSLQDRSASVTLAGVQRAAPVLDHYISEQMEKYNVPADKTALLGFSQGSMMSLYVGPRFPEKLAGVLAYSGALVGGEALGQDGINKQLPVHLIHGDADDVVPVSLYYHAQETLQANGFDVSGEVTPGLMHNIDEAGIASGSAFLKKIFE
ncbi:MAG: phospholipase [Rhodospirillales bacterium]|nr:phospholipase [Rhodospirillales bacterium]